MAERKTSRHLFLCRHRSSGNTSFDPRKEFIDSKGTTRTSIRQATRITSSGQSAFATTLLGCFAYSITPLFP